jgi:hypothetical protein
MRISARNHANPAVLAAEDITDADTAGDTALETAIGVVRTQVRLQNLDIWFGTPTTLRMKCSRTTRQGDNDLALLQLAGEILTSREPELGRYPMLRYVFGASEDLEDALAVLRPADLVVRRKKGRVGHVVHTNYFLLQAGRDM